MGILGLKCKKNTQKQALKQMTVTKIINKIQKQNQIVKSENVKRH